MVQKVCVVTGELPQVVNGTVDLVGPTGFGPVVAAILFAGFANTTNNPQDGMAACLGFYTPDFQGCKEATASDNVGTTVTTRASSITQCLSLNNAANQWQASAIDDGIRLTMTADATAVNRYVTAMLFGGTVQAAAGNKSINTNTTNNTSTVSGLTFVPKLVFTLSNAHYLAEGTTSTGMLMIAGTRRSDNAHRYKVYLSSTTSASGNPRTRHSSSTAGYAFGSFSTANNHYGAITSWNDDGWVYTVTTGWNGGGSKSLIYLALGGDDLSFADGQMYSATSGNDTLTTGFDVGALMVWSGTEITTGTTADAYASGHCFGMAGKTTQACVSFFDEFGADPTNTGSVWDASNVLNVDSSASNSRTDVLTAAASFGTTDATLTYSLQDATNGRRTSWYAFENERKNRHNRDYGPDARGMMTTLRM